MKRLSFALLAASLWAAISGAATQSEEDRYQNPPEHPIPIDADELFQAYKNNPKQSDSFYKGHLIDIYGIAEKPYGPVGDYVLISFRVSTTPNPYGVLGVQASISKKYSAFYSKIVAGDKVSMICTGGGQDKNGMPWLLNCHP